MLKLFKKTVKKYYKVSGRYYLSKEELADLFSCCKSLYIRKEGERGFGRPVSLDDTYEDAWIDLNMTFQDKQMALDYARKYIADSLDGGYADLKQSTKPFFPDDDTTIICEIRKENGKIIEINHC